MNITAAQRRALEAVRDGKGYRIYRNNGNTLHCEGVASSVLWALDRLNMIQDGKADNPGAMQIRCPLELTDIGRKILWHQE